MGYTAVVSASGSIAAALSGARSPTMWIIFLEAGVALLLLLVIVLATWPKKDPARKTDDES